MLTTKDKVRLLNITFILLLFHVLTILPVNGIDLTFLETFESLNTTELNFYWGGDPVTWNYACGVVNYSITSTYSYKGCSQEGSHYLRKHPSNASFHNTTYIGFQMNNFLPNAPAAEGNLLTYIFPSAETILLSDFINISFDSYHITSGTAVFYLKLRLLNLSNDKQFDLPIQMLSDSNTLWNACTLDSMGLPSINISFIRHSFTNTDIKNGCLPGQDLSIYRLLEYTFNYRKNAEDPVPVPVNIYLDNIRVTVTDNSLPLYNASLSGDVCLTSTLESLVNISSYLTLSAYDPEGDAIYYSLKANEEQMFYTYSFADDYYDSRSCNTGLEGFLIKVYSYIFPYIRDECQELIDISAPEPVFSDLDSCQVDFDNLNNSNFYVDQYPNNEDNFKYMLVYNPNCQKQPETFMKTNANYKDFYYSTNLYLLKYINNTFNLTLYDNPWQQEYVLRLKFLTVSQDNVTVYEINESNEHVLMSIDTTNSKIGLANYLGLDISYDYESNSYNLTVGIDNSSVYTYSGDNRINNSGKLIKYIGLRIRNKAANYLYHEIFSYGGFSLMPEWSAYVPNAEVLKKGTNLVNLYITDEYHKDMGIYNLSTLLFQARVDGSCTYTPSRIGNTDPDAIQENKDILGFLKYMLGTPFKEYLIQVGQYENGKTIVYWLWVILVLIFFVLEYFITNKLDFTVPMAIPSLIFFFLSFLVEYTGNMVVFAFMFAIPLAGVFAGLYTGGHYAK